MPALRSNKTHHASKKMKSSVLALCLLVGIFSAHAIDTQINLNFAGLIPPLNGGDNGSGGEPQPEPDRFTTIIGEQAVPYGWGTLSTFIQFKNDQLNSVGIRLSEPLLDVFPAQWPNAANAPLGWVLDIPTEANPSVFRSVQIGFNPEGISQGSIKSNPGT